MNDIATYTLAVHINNNSFRAWVSVSNLMFTCKDGPIHNLIVKI